MSDLLQAAKAVIECWDDPQCPPVMHVDNLRAAVERVEKQENEPLRIDDMRTSHIWNSAQQAERERIKKIVEAVGVQGEHDQWFDACDTIMERIDER